MDLAFRKFGIRTREVAISIGVSEATVRSWRLGRTNIKPRYAREVFEKFGIPLHMLRPDTWDAPAEPSEPHKRRTEASPRKAA